MSDSNDPKLNPIQETHHDNFRYKAAAFLAGVTGMSLLGGFGLTLTWAKKQDPEMFTKGITTAGKAGGGCTMESGGSLALRALGRGTLYSVTGFAVFCYGIWTLMGVHSVRWKRPLSSWAVTHLHSLMNVANMIYIVVTEMDEFRRKVGGVLPPIPRNNPSQSRTEFDGVRDLLQYLIDEDTKRSQNVNSHPPATSDT